MSRLPQLPAAYDAVALKRQLDTISRRLDNLEEQFQAKETASFDNHALSSMEEGRFYFRVDPNRTNIDLVLRARGRIHRIAIITDGALGATGGQAPADAQYVVSSADPALPFADVLTGTANQIIVSPGTNLNTLSFPVSDSTNVMREDAGTNNVQNALVVARNSTGTPAAGFGTAAELRLETTTTTNTRVAAMDVQHVVPTHAARTARLRLLIADFNGDREVLRIESDGTQGLLSFFGGGAVAKQAAITQTYATASATHAARTAQTLTDNSGGTANTTVQALPDLTDSPADADALRDDIMTNWAPALRNNAADLAAQINALKADSDNTAQVLNTVVDYLQAYTLTS